MNKILPIEEFRLKLETNFPDLFLPTYHDKNVYPWCISTPAVWQEEIYKCVKKLKNEIDRRDKIIHPQHPVIEQIKEKFGFLRIYICMSPKNDFNNLEENSEFHSILNKIIDDTEIKCFTMCCVCGSTVNAIQRNTFPEHNIPAYIMGAYCKKCWHHKTLSRAKFSSHDVIRQWYYDSIVCTEFIKKE